MLRIGIAAAIAGLVVALAPPAAASEDDYLRGLQERYTFLTAEQLLSEGQRACAATNAGVKSPDIVVMVRRDLGVATGVAMDILSGATASLCPRT